MARTLGKVSLDGKTWGIECEAHVSLRLKRVFQKIHKGQFGKLTLSDSPENCRELLWFMDRYPLEISDVARTYLEHRARVHEALEASVERIMAADYEPPQFELAMPPRRYQRVAAELALLRGSLLLADSVGLGKTASAITTLTDPRTLPALVVTLTHLPRQWQAEIAKFAPALRTHILKKGTPYDMTVFRKKAVPSPDVIITSYSKLGGWAETLAGKVKSIILDECQELRHDGTDKYKAAKHIADSADFRIGTSATPFYNYGGEMFNVMDVVSPGVLGEKGEFIREWCAGSGMDVGRYSIRDPKAFGTYLRDQGVMLLRTREDVGRELPPLTKAVHYIEADLEEINKIASSAAELAKIILGGGAGWEKLRASEELDMRMRQATGIAKAAYVAEFVNMIVDSGEPVVVYAWHREVYSILSSKLAHHSPAMYTGTESARQKEESARRFVSGETKVLLMSLRSGAGLDGLQGVSRVVIFAELDWSPGVHEQAIGRVYRDGQGAQVIAYFLVAQDGSDPVISDVLGLKASQIQGVLDPFAEAVQATEGAGVNIKKLAESFLRSRGIAIEKPEDAAPATPAQASLFPD